MATISLTAKERQELVRILATYADIDTAIRRQIFLDKTGLSDALPGLMPRVPREGSTEEFCYVLIELLQKQGTLPNTQQPALVLVLRYLLDEVVSGQANEIDFLDRLLAPIQPTGDPTRPLKIFVSYRRKSWAFTQRLVEQLQQSLNADIFVDLMGVDESNFEHAILRNLQESDAVLLVVSEHTFSPKIQEPTDWVRREIAMALHLNKPITLVAVDGLYPPSPHQLPDDIATIGKMQGVPFYPEPELWDGALRRLVKFLEVVVSRTLHHEPNNHSEFVVTPPATVVSLQTTFTKALEFLDVGEWDKGLLILNELVAQGYRPRFVSLEELMVNATTQRNIAIRWREMADAYQEIAPLARFRATESQALKAWQQFKEAYPEFDLANDTEKLGELEQRLTITLSPTQALSYSFNPETLQHSSEGLPLKPINLPPRQKRLLEILWERRNEVCSYEDLIAYVYSDRQDLYQVENGTLSALVSDIRKKLPYGVIETIRGIGVRLISRPIDSKIS